MSNTINTTKEASDPFWGNQFNILIESNRISEFYPTFSQSLNERVNSLSRMIIYISIILSFYNSNATPLHFGAFLLFIIYLMYKNQSIEKINTKINEINTEIPEGFANLKGLPDLTLPTSECQMPTLQNPFMNQLLFDNPLRGEACMDESELAIDFFHKQNDMFTDVDDLYGKNNFDRMFITNPSTSRVPDREKFANYLTGDVPNCKQDNNCLRNSYVDPRFNRRDDILQTLSGYNI